MAVKYGQNSKKKKISIFIVVVNASTTLNTLKCI